MKKRQRALRGVLVVICASFAPSAWASSFDSQGWLVFDPEALYTQSFESGAAPPGGAALVSDPTAVNGTHLLRIPAERVATLTVDVPRRDTSVTFSLYSRGGGALGEIGAQFSGEGLPYAGGYLFPTGRVTSDGWIEMKSAPVSLPLERSGPVTLTLINVSGQDADVDGVEVIREGAYREARACSPPDASSCASGDVCAVGYCVDAAAYLPPLPPGPDRENFPSWLATSIDANFGGIASRPAGLPGALATLRAMPSASNATAYWSTLTAAIQRLHDSHSVPDIGFQPPDALGLCFVQGDADLSHRQAPSDPVYPDVLVSHGVPGQMGGLVPGDRLVAVNGMHPVAFERSLVGLTQGNTQSTDPTEYEHNLIALNTDVRTWATTITVIHCDAATKECSRPYTIPVKSLPVLPFADAPACDDRPAYHLAAGNPDPVTHQTQNDVYFGALAGTSSDEALYGMIFDSLAPNPGPDPYAGPLASIAAEAKGVVLDARMGYGGGFEYATEISAPFLNDKTLTATWQDEPYFWNSGWTHADGASEFAAVEALDSFAVGSSTPTAGLKAAVLVAYDVSADDFFAYGMRGGINGVRNVRSFGTKSAGAFAAILNLSYAAEAVWIGIGVGDSFTPSGVSLDGTGAEPDEHVVPLQSDLLAGRDTAYERALAWLRCSTCDANETSDSKGGTK